MTRHTEAVFDWVVPYVEDDSYMEYLQYQNMWIAHRLLGLRTEKGIEEAVKVVGLLYVWTVLVRGYGNNSAMIRGLVACLRKAVERVQVDGVDSDGLEEVVLWVAFVGAHCSWEEEDGLFFADLFWEQARVLEMAEYADLRRRLDEYLFVGTVYGETLRRMCNRRERDYGS